MREIVGSVALFAISLVMLWGYLRSDVEAGAVATLAALFVTVGLPALVGVALLRKHRRMGRGRSDRTALLRQQTLESEVLRAAVTHHGRLTVIEVTADLGVSAEEAKDVLDGLMVKGLADIEVSDSGLLVYRFHEIEHLEEKNRTRNLLDG